MAADPIHVVHSVAMWDKKTLAYRTVDVLVIIDTLEIAKTLGNKAFDSRTQRAQSVFGAIKVVVNK